MLENMDVHPTAIHGILEDLVSKLIGPLPAEEILITDF
jgi:hypothetical protein